MSSQPPPEEGIDTAQLLDTYAGREATAVKHFILLHYLERLAHKVGSWCNTLNYVEGFAGPWMSATEDYADTSPHIAITELRKARSHLEKIDRHPQIHCVFCEVDPKKAQTLETSLERYDDVEARVLQGPFLSHTDDILRFVQNRTAPNPRFTFYFVDPTGWTGFDPDEIAPLLRAGHTEVLVNFMTKDIIRFIGSGNVSTSRSFDPLFGSVEARDQWHGLQGRSREEAIVRAFCDRLKQIGNFKYVISTIVLHPTYRRTHFHLIYGTRDEEGLRTFRRVEHDSVAEQDRLRERARQRERIARTSQPDLFPPDAIETQTDLHQLREECQDRALDTIMDLLVSRGTISFDELEIVALQYPMVSNRELQDWIDMLRDAGRIEVGGLKPSAHVLRPESGHTIIWVS